jgi:hypothetical protein
MFERSFLLSSTHFSRAFLALRDNFLTMFYSGFESYFFQHIFRAFLPLEATNSDNECSRSFFLPHIFQRAFFALRDNFLSILDRGFESFFFPPIFEKHFYKKEAIFNIIQTLYEPSSLPFFHIF